MISPNSLPCASIIGNKLFALSFGVVEGAEAVESEEIGTEEELASRSHHLYRNDSAISLNQGVKSFAIIDRVMSVDSSSVYDIEERGEATGERMMNRD